MKVLGVDTSTDSLTVSLIDEKKILASYNSIGTLKHSALLLPLIEKTLKKSGAKIEDIDLFSVGVGPGSFTGLRVGITAMRALAIALNKPIIGVPTMDAIAHNGFTYLKKAKLLDKYPRICPVLDAKKKQVYACVYRHDGVKIIRETNYLLEPVENLIKRIRGPVLFLGNAIPLCKEKLAAWQPKASVIAGMALKEHQSGRRHNPYDLVPLYLYARDCQVKK